MSGAINAIILGSRDPRRLGSHQDTDDILSRRISEGRASIQEPR